jgi:asparagine synthase (glutamine-hydrolysing)
MIEFFAIRYSDPWFAGQRTPNAQRQGWVSGDRIKYQKEFRRPGISMTIAGDEPIDSFVHESPEVTLICYTDLLSADAVVSTDLRSDPAACLVQLYEQYGETFAARLSGTFAIILYEHRTRLLRAWTDHFGVQKLAFADLHDSFAMSTDLRALLPLFPDRPDIDPVAVEQYLQYTCIPAPRTIYKGISRLKPGHVLTFGTTPVTRPYWQMKYSENSQHRTERDWASKTFSAIRSAVGRNLVGTDSHNLGCFLSGGTDSSSIAGLVRHLTNQPPHTFSIGFDDPRYNEIQYARIAAAHCTADHQEYFVTPDDILALIENAVLAYDEPFGNSSIVPTYYCARLAAQNGITHLLAGDGGDELFGGNARYVEDRVFQRYGSIPRCIRRGLIEPVVRAGASWTNLRLFDRAARYVRRSNIDVPDRLFSYSLLSSTDGAGLFAPGFASAVTGCHPLDPAREHFSAALAANDLNRWLYLDLKIIITDNDLRKVTTMSRLAGVTPRYPLLDPMLADFSGTVPAALKVRENQLRYLFKKAMAGILPPEIIAKPKHGFGLPYSVWLGEYQPLRDFTFDVLGSSRCRQRGYFRKDLLEWLWSQYRGDDRKYYGDILWVFLMLELWHTMQHDKSAADRRELVPVAHG